MNILISNDDGIFSEGILTLANVLSKEHNVLVVAPDGNRSGYAHSVSFYKDLVIKECKISNKFDSFAFSGTPADCVKFGIHFKDDVKFDLVCSGINLGSNLGTDTFYSGTVAACIEANVEGYPAIAFSYVDDKNFDSETCSEIVIKVIDLLKDKLDDSYMWNVNIPNLPYDKIKGVKFTKLGVHKYTDVYLFENGKYQLVGEPIEGLNDDEDCDVELCGKGFVTITPIVRERTALSVLEKYQKDYKL